ncbi:MAG: helix-turn-helix domain-containing protein [bacterium]
MSTPKRYVTLLQSLGLSESEASLYLAGLSTGPATAIQLGKKIGMSRQMVYTLLDRLASQGLMKEITTDGKRLFQAIGPEALNDKARQIAKDIEEAVPLLKTREASNASLPTISVYENPISMREWYREFMNQATPGEELLVWATNTAWHSVDPEFLTTFIEFKKRVGTADRIIAPDTADSREFTRQNQQSNAQFRFSTDWWETDTEKWIWRDTICFLSIRENATNLIVVRSKQLAALERFGFEKAWLTLAP